MTEPVLTCTPQTSLAVAARLIREADYGTLAVIGEARRLVGIITDRDVRLALAGTRRNAVNIVVRETMTPKVFTICCRRSPLGAARSMSYSDFKQISFQ